MKQSSLSAIAGTLLLIAFQSSARQALYTLPSVIKIDLERIEETYNILDRYANQIWPGWNNYEDVPFLMEYPDGSALFVGDATPPPGFNQLLGISVGGSRAYVDIRKRTSLTMSPPMLGGGNVAPISASPGKVVYGPRFRRVIAGDDVRIQMLSKDSLFMAMLAEKHWPRELLYCSEQSILDNIHELFHGFQENVYVNELGTLQLNPDAHYANYAEIEGSALEKAYCAQPDQDAKEYLKDFLVARAQKRKSLTPKQQLRESAGEIGEGLPTYTELTAVSLFWQVV